MKLNVYTYSSAIQFLTDSYKNFKDESGTGLRKLSISMGFESPSLLMDLLKKKRPLKLKYADYLIQGLNLSREEGLYFKTLIQLEKASEEGKAYLLDVLASLRPNDTYLQKEKGIFSHWINMVIFTMSQMGTMPVTLETIKKSLKTSVPDATIQDSLDLLVENNLLEVNGKTYINKIQDFVTSQNDVPTKTVHDYYSQVFSKAQSAVGMDVKDREIQCFSIGMKKDDLSKVKEVIRRARLEIAGFSDESGDHVYQFNLSGFPLAEMINH